MAPLRSYLRRLGHEARGWGLGVNTGYPERDSEILAGQVAAQHEQTGRKVALVGWSLGGVIARETARTVPHAVSRVITYGTPAIGGPTYTLGAQAFGPSESALEGSGWDSMNTPDTPTDTAARASTGTNSR